MNIFKLIWKYFFGKKKIIREPWMTDKVIEIAKQSILDFEKKEKQKKSQTQLFRKQQLAGKIYNIGKSSFRIKKKLGEAGEKLKYHIELLI